MSPAAWASVLPEWLRSWIRYQLLPVLGLDAREMAWGVLRGVFDTLLLLLLGVGFLTGGRIVMDGQYALPRATQATVLKWAPIADHIARRIDIPREVPLVLWFKENGVQRSLIGRTVLMSSNDVISPTTRGRSRPTTESRSIVDPKLFLP